MILISQCLMSEIYLYFFIEVCRTYLEIYLVDSSNKLFVYTQKVGVVPKPTCCGYSVMIDWTKKK